MRNLRLDLCYDGTRYRGWQRLPNSDMTLQGKLENVLSRILGESIEISGSGRTDAGVHAQRQVANFHCSSSMSCEDILQQMRRYLPEDIGIYSCKDVSSRFHARLNAKSKTYCYRIWNSGRPCVFDRRYVTVDNRKPHLASMEKAARLLEGTHDFSAFCANRHMKKTTVRTINQIQIVQLADELRITINANGFLYHMMRILVGTLMEVGMGTRDADSVKELFGKQRAQAGELMPPTGLCLMEVSY